MTTIPQLQDEVLALKAQLAGKCIVLAMASGDREGAQLHKDLMYAAIRERHALAMHHAEKAGGCFFDASGAADRVGLGVSA